MQIFSYRAGEEFNGILRNIPETSFSLTNSSIDSVSYLKYIVQNETTKYWCSNNNTWQYFVVDFKGIYVSLDRYSIKAGEWIHNFPQRWSVAGFDGVSWHNISNVEKSGLEKALDKGNYMTFNRNFFKSFKFTHTGPNEKGNNYFCICCFEMFGKVAKTMPNKASLCKKRYETSVFGLSLLIIIQTHS